MKICWLIPNLDFDIHWLKNNVVPEDVVLPLSLAALARCKEHLSNVLSIEEFVPYTDIKALAVRAHEINKEFSRLGCQGASLDGYDWPRICWHTQQWFFRDIVLAERLSSALEPADFDSVIWVGNPGHRPAVYSQTMDVVATAMKFYLGKRFEILHPPRNYTKDLYHCWAKRFQNGLACFNKRVFYREPEISNCQVVAIFSGNEWERYTDAVSELMQEWGEQFQMWILGGRYSDRLKKWAKSVSITPLKIGYPETVDEDISCFFTEHWQKWLTENRKKFAQVSNISIFSTDQLLYHFRFYFKRYWPHTAQWARKVEHCLQRAMPHWVVASSNYDPEWALPHYLASKIGIPSIALPHSYVQYGDGAIRSTFLACRNVFQRLSFQKAFPDDTHVLYCHNAGNALSYSPQSKNVCDDSHRLIVAVLTADPDYAGSLMPTADRRVFWDALTALFSVPSDLDEFEFVLKSHPRGNVTSLLQDWIGDGSLNVTLLDSSASVIELLEKAWVVVLYNHYGGVVVQAVMSGKPMIFLDSAKTFWPYTDKLAFPAGEVIEDVSAFWNLMHRLRDSPMLYQELSERCQKFRKKYLQPIEQTLVQRICLVEAYQVSALSYPAVQPPRSV